MDARFERRARMAAQAVLQLEDELSGLELLLMRLDAIPAGVRAADWEQVREQTEANIEAVTAGIERMRAEAVTVQSTNGAAPNRAARRAKKR